MLIKPEVNTQEEIQVAASTVEAEVQTQPEIKEEEIMTTEIEKTEVAAVAEQAQAPTTVTAQREHGVKAFQAEQAEMGFEGIEVGAFSFDRVKLDDGQFLMGSDDVELGSSFEFVTMSTRNIFVVRQGNFQDADTFYSYSADGSTTTDGSSSQETLDKWKEDGYGTDESPLDIKKYMEVMAELVTEDENNGAIVNLSIPPSSLQRFGGVAMIAKARFHANLNEVVIKAIVGAKAGEGSKSFRPWNFKISRKLA